MPRFGERAFQKIILQCELADLGVQRHQVHRLLGFSRTAAESVRSMFEQLPLPVGDLVGMQAEMLGQFGQGSVFTQCGYRHLRLEYRRMGAAGAPR